MFRPSLDSFKSLLNARRRHFDLYRRLDDAWQATPRNSAGRMELEALASRLARPPAPFVQPQLHPSNESCGTTIGRLIDWGLGRF